MRCETVKDLTDQYKSATLDAQPASRESLTVVDKVVDTALRQSVEHGKNYRDAKDSVQKRTAEAFELKKAKKRESEKGTATEHS